MKQEIKHTPQTSQEQLSQSQAHQAAAREFATAEAALREDIQQAVVPPAIEQRLSKSIENLPKPEKPWWKKILGN